MHRLFSALLVLAVANAQYVCNGVTQVNAPAVYGTAVDYPPGANSTYPLQIAPNQNCTFQVNIPVGTYATMLLINNQLGSGSYVKVWNNAGIDDMLSGSFAPASNFYYFPPTVAFVQVKTGSLVGNVLLEFKWYQMPQMATQSIPVDPRDQLKTKPVTMLLSTAVTISRTPNINGRITLASLPPDPSLLPYYLASFVFDGPTTNATVIGTLRNTIYGQTVSSSGNFVTIMCVGLYTTQYLGSFAAIASENLAMYSGYQLDYAGTGAKYHRIGTSNDTSKMYALTVMTPMQISYLDTIDPFVPGSTFTVYAGTPNAMLANYKLATYASGDRTLGNQLPQQFLGQFFTFTASGGFGFQLTTQTEAYSKWNTVAEGRSGFVMSKNYPFADDQTMTTTFSNNKNVYSFSYTLDALTQSSVANGSYAQVIISNGSKQTSNVKYTTTSANSKVTAVGTQMAVSFYSSSVHTTGGLLRFTVSKSVAQAAYFLPLLLVVLKNLL